MLVVMFSLFISQVNAYSVGQTQNVTISGKRIYDRSLTGGHYGSAEVITVEEIEQSNARTVADVLQSRIGINKFSNGTGSNLEWALNWNGFNSGEETTVIVDGIKVNEADQNDVYWSNIPLSEVEKIEVLPGAFSSLHGSGAFAGVINIVTKKDTRNHFSAKAGSYGYGSQKISVGENYGDYYYRLLYGHQAESGYRDNSAYNQSHFSVKTGWSDEDSELNLSFQDVYSNLNYPDQLTMDEIKEDRTQSIAGDQRKIKTQLSTLEYINLINNDWTVAFNSGIKNRDIAYYSDSRTGTDQYIDALEGNTSYVLQLSYRDLLVLGYDHRLSNIFSKTYNYDMAKHQRGAITADDDATKSESAPYFQLFKSIGNWKLRYGAREDLISYCNTDINGQREDLSFSKRSHSGEIGYQLNESSLVFVNYGEAFKAPTFYDLFGTYGNKQLDPEQSKTEQAGLRYTAESLDVLWSVYRTKVTDEIMTEPLAVAPWGKQVNLNETQRQGYEVRLNKNINQGSVFYANYLYTKARVLKGSADWSTTELEGYAIPFVPEHKYTIGFNTTVSSFFLALEHNFVNSQYSVGDFENSEIILPAYNYTDAKLIYSFSEDLQLSLEIFNLFNNIYSNRSGYFWSGSWDTFYMPTDPRTASVGMEYRF